MDLGLIQYVHKEILVDFVLRPLLPNKNRGILVDMGLFLAKMTL